MAAYYSIWVVLAAWAVGTLILEFSLGWPTTRETWGHRMIGWFINYLLLQTFLKGYKRYLQIKAVK